MKTSKWIVIIGIVAVAGMAAVWGCDKRGGEARGGKGGAAGQGHDHGDGHSHAAARKPESFGQMMRFIREHAANIEREIGAGQLSYAHDDASAIAELAADAGKVAMADAAVAKEKVRDVNVAGKELAAAAEALHVLADAGKVDDTKPSFAALAGLIEQLAAAAGLGQGWWCPMRCEPGKLYEGAGKCPVCRMALVRKGEEPYAAMVTPVSAVLAPGKPVELKVELLTPAGEWVKDLQVVHEHELHLMTVSNDLSWYSHDHPVRRADGTFAMEQTFPHAGEYTFFADFSPKGGKQEVPTAAMEIAGKWPERVPLVEDIDSVKAIDGYTVRMRCNGGPFVARRDEVVRYGIGIGEDATTVPDLEQIMGALGHLVIIGDDLTTFVHAHPLNDEVKKGAATVGGGDGHAGHEHGGATPESLMAKAAAYANGSEHDPVFHVVFPKPGLYKSFAQFQRKGKMVTVPFTMDVKAGEAGAPSEGKHEHEKSGGGQ